jgi:uncharacterized protein
MKRLFWIAALLVSVALLAPAQQASPLEQQLFDEIAGIKTFDNHTHLAFSEADRGYDALPCDALQSSAQLPLFLRSDQPDFAAGAKAVFGLQSSGDQALKDSAAAKRQKRAQLGDKYEEWLLDQVNIETVLVDRTEMPQGRAVSSRIHWVPYDDALLFPLNNDGLKAASPDRKVLIGAEKQHLKEYLSALNLESVPARLDAYLAQVVMPTLEHQASAGAFAIKFEVAYLRTLKFERVGELEASLLYRKAQKSRLSNQEYLRLQDYIFRVIAYQAGHLGLPLHIHTGFGCGDSFMMSDADPLLLENIVTDPLLARTKFVLLHAPWSDRAAAQMLVHPNVYVDISLSGMMLSKQHFAEALRNLLELYPEKLLYGSDAGPVAENVDFEATAWVYDRHAKQAVARALAGMVTDGELTHPQALEIAHKVLHDNAAQLYSH